MYIPAFISFINTKDSNNEFELSQSIGKGKELEKTRQLFVNVYPKQLSS